MRILWVKAGKLLPVDTGGKIRTYNILKSLVAHHEVTLLSYHGGPPDPAYAEALRSQFPGAIVLGGLWPVSAPGVGAAYLRCLPTGLPFTIGKFTSRAVRGEIEAGVAAGRYDVAVCDFLAPSANFPERLSIPAFLFQHNVESALWVRRAQHERNPLKRPVYNLEAARLAAYEPRAVRRFTGVIAVSEHDRDLMARWVEPSRIRVTPTGVDLAGFRAGATDPATSGPLIVFVGSMDWEPNVDGMLWFHQQVWPRIASTIPGARLRIVGRQPPPSIARLAGGGVEVTGAVPSVVGHLHEAAVVVVPLRIGGGTRLKIYEAMAARRPVVSTTIGAEGLDVRPGEDIVFADEPGAFAEAVIDLLRDPAKRTAIGDRAALRAAMYDWPNVAGSFANLLDPSASPLPPAHRAY